MMYRMYIILGRCPRNNIIIGILCMGTFNGVPCFLGGEVGMVRILHTADMHLDSAFTSRLGLKEAEIRRSEQRAVFSKIISIARERADILLIAGDLFDGRHVTEETVAFLRRKFKEISDIPVLIAAGNHDPYTADSVYAAENLGDNVRVFAAGGECFDFEELKLRVCGASFANENGSNLPRLGRFPLQNGMINVAVIHGDTLSGNDDRYNPIRQSELEGSGFDYVALGHIHTFSGFNRAGKTLWAYPGIPEPRGFDESAERGAAGAALIELGSDGAEAYELIDVHERLYHRLSLKIDESCSDNEQLFELASEMISRYDSRDLFEITLEGKTPAGFSPNTELLSIRLRGSAFYITFLDKTEPERDLSAEDGDNSLRAVYIRLMRERIDNAAAAEEKMIAELALKIGVDSIDNS